MFRVNNKDIRTIEPRTLSLVYFEQVNVCWDVIKSLLSFGLFKNPIYNFSWHNALKYKYR